MTIKYNSDLLGARFDSSTPLEATMYWNKADPRQKTLRRAYTYAETIAIHPAVIQQGVFEVAGMEGGKLSDLRIIAGDLVWDDYLRINRGE
jgi:hypothetical protein